MKQIARFEKVSVDEYVRSRARNQFGKDKPSDVKWYQQCLDAYRAEWEKIQLPTRATEGSAGYDFFIPGHYHLFDDFSGLGESNITICTGIRALIDPGYVLMLYPRSGLGFKYGVRLINTTGIIDSDYSNARNEGHIMVKLRSEKELDFNQGDRFIQGVFLPYGITYDDKVSKSRSGGFGSTGS